MNQININDYKYSKLPQFKSDGASQALPLQQNSPQGYPNNYILPQVKQQKVELPYIYRVPNEENKKDGFFKTMFKTVFGSVAENPLLFGGVFLGASWGADKVASKFGGEYSKSWLGKAANAGDKLEQSKFVQSKPMQSVLGLFKKAGKGIDSTLGQTDIVKAMRETPCAPEFPMAKNEILSVEQRIIHEEFSNIARTLELTTDAPIKFGNVKPSKAEKEMLKKLFSVSSITEISESEATNAVLLKRLKEKHLTDDVIRTIARSDESSAKTKAEMLKSMGLTTQKASEILADEKCTMIDDIYKALEKSKGKIKADGCYKKWLGPVQIFSREIGTDQAFNRLHSIKNGAKTKTGRFFSKAVQRLHRCLTFGGGKIGILLFIAPHLVHTIKSTIKAEPREKVGTAVGGTLGMGLWILTMPITAQLIYALGGIRHAGMGKDKVAENEKLIQKFNETIFDSYDSYKNAKKQLKETLKSNRKVGKQSLATKVARKIAGVFTCDLNMIKPYQAEGKTLMNSLRKMGNTTKNVINVPIRFLVFMAISGKLDDLILKGISGIFGKAHDITLDEEHEELKKQQRIYTKKDLNNRMLEIQKAKMTGVQPNLNLDEQEKTMSAIADSLAKDYVPKKKKTKVNNTVTPVDSNKEIVPENPEKAVKQPQENKELQQNEPVEVKPLEQLNQEEEDNAVPVAPVYVPEKEEVSKEAIPYNNLPKATTPVKVNNVYEPVDNYTYIPSSKVGVVKPAVSKRDNYTYIPSSENLLKKDDSLMDTNKYIPSQLGANITKTFDNSGLAEALRRADRAEQRAIEVLNGKF